MSSTRSGQIKFALCALSGVVMALAWPPSPWCILAPILMVPFLVFWFPHRHRWVGVGMTYVFFLSFTLITMRWMFQLQGGTAGLALVVAAMLLIPVVQGVPYVIFRLAGKWLRNSYWLLLIPLVNLSIEMAQYRWDLAFTWLHMGLSTSSAWPETAGFSTWGFGGMSLLVYTANVLAAIAIIHRKYPVKRWTATGAFILVVTLLFVPPGPSAGPVHNGTLKVAIAEPRYDPNEYRDDELYRHSRIIDEALREASARGVGLVVFPEGYLRNFGSHPVLLGDWDSNPAMREIRQRCKALRINLITGAIGIKTYGAGESVSVSARPAKKGGWYDMQNVVILIDSAGEVQYRAKSRLVPFMERVPFLEAWEGAERWKLSINKAKGSYLGGNGLSHFDLGGINILPLVCYESLFDSEVSVAVEQETDLIIEVSNEAWPGSRLMTEQHAAYARAASLAYAKPYLRSAVGGGTACFRCGDKEGYVELPGGPLLITEIPIIGVFR